MPFDAPVLLYGAGREARSTFRYIRETSPGTKVFVTNAGFADLFSVYAKVDGEHFTAFLVEADRPGVSTGAEEHTCPSTSGRRATSRLSSTASSTTWRPGTSLTASRTS